MSKAKGLLIDIGAGLVVLIIATLLLSATNYRNNQADLKLEYREPNSNITVHDENKAGNIYLLKSQFEATDTFPEFAADIDWENEVVLAYVESPQPTSGYTLDVVGVMRQGPVVTVDYQLLMPAPGTINLTVLSQPTLLVALQRTDLIASSQLTLRLHNIFNDQTTSLSFDTQDLL